ncbi:hypothetical protein EV192_1021078 [Actinocrispum wychmicini]|uniref:Uncharacterized protein n=2 Tax=Actinocrispum wychmicini TaxID=1213861 RepID=A0A4R2JZR5_9PSEU|nr:hypothetical protein EV192_1021078 [Actinocrispum wychmicini]
MVVAHLGEVAPAFDIPGRRKDGTITGERLVRRFFWNVLRGAVGVPINVVLSVLGGGAANLFAREGHVTGPANAQALDLLDAARPAKNPWLVYSESHLAIIDTPLLYDPKDNTPPVILWHATQPHALQHNPRKRILTWPDGSAFEYHLSMEEANQQFHERPR